ncbi:MAG: hypothetical protein HY694_18420 [Deltaproteobacteria bacterium]|nr:hypothetical protein [Deltaproteobacteria bacterium]
MRPKERPQTQDQKDEVSSEEDTEYKREVDAIENGVARFRQVLKAQGSNSKLGRKLLKLYFEPLSRSIREKQEEIERAKDQGQKYTLPLLTLPAEKLSFITLQCILENIGFIEDEELEDAGVVGIKETLAARQIGERCWLEQRIDQLEKRERKLLEILLKRYPKAIAVRVAKRRLKKFDPEDWTKNNFDLHLGFFLINAAIKIGFVKRDLLYLGKGKRPKVLKFSGRTERELQKLRSCYEALAGPVFTPMLVPPRPWCGLHNGGYLINGETRTMLLIKHKSSWEKDGILKRFQDVDLEVIASAVNALQRTAWRINKGVYYVLKDTLQGRRTLAGLGAVRKLPPKLRWGDPDYDKRKVEREFASSNNRKVRLCRRVIIPMRLKVCEELLDKRFYLPFQLDFRGRAYPIPQILSPQSDDIGRALLEFAEGNCLGKDGEYWLKVHLANKYGKDKEPFEDRVKWVEENQENIRASAEEPLRNRWWMSADKPWCFLAACLEWANYLKDPRGFESHLPIHMDGTCNGLQHLSAMALDEEGGRATNLLPGEEPEDIYQHVANKLVTILWNDYAQGIPEALDWLENAKELFKDGRASRGLAKHATMTKPYGVTQYRIAEQLRRDGWTWGLKAPTKGAWYVACRLEEAIGKVASKALEVMKWMRGVAETLANEDRSCSWTTPIGLRVVLECRKQKLEYVKFLGRKYSIYRQDTSRKVDAEEQKTKIVANFVHSMDAAHMMLTVNELHTMGYQSFAMIHDSYGVHACNVPIMNQILRDKFVQIYESPILDQFIDELRAGNPGITLENPPKRGKLVIGGVLKSSYFFC